MNKSSSNRRKAKQNDADWLEAELLACAGDLDRFNDVILGRGPYWWRQVEICRSVETFRTTVVKAGNAVGKGYVAAGILLGLICSYPNSKAVVAAPTQGQLAGAFWSEFTAAHTSAARNGFPLGGKLRSLTYELGENWRVEGYGMGSVESKSGRHAADLFAILDEGSGVPASVWEAVDSLNPSKYLVPGNPLRPEGKFYELCELSGDNPHVNVITIPSTESPDIELERSPRGMADRTWLESSRAEYGEDSIWWASHVLAKFPNEISEGLLPIPWLTLAGQTIHLEGGERWIGVDLGEGVGGDPSELVARDDNGIIGWESSNRWSLETTAGRVRAMSDELNVDPNHIVYDAGGLGTDFDARLRAEGLNGCRGYKGGRGDQSGRFRDVRTASHWALRKRLDPKRQIRHVRGDKKLWLPQTPFALRPDLLTRYRAELQGVRYQLHGDEIQLEPKVDFQKRLKRSPNFVDAWAMTYAFPFA